MAGDLPDNTRLDDLSWEESIGFLEDIRRTGLPVLIHTVDPRSRNPVHTARGYISGPGKGLKQDGVWYTVQWPHGKANGGLSLPRDLFESGSLSTIDGSDYMWLALSFGTWTVGIEDVNLIDWPEPAPFPPRSQRKTLDDLTTAEELKEDLASNKDNPINQEFARDLVRIRERLINSGVEAASDLSIFEIGALVSRAIWRLKEEALLPEITGPEESRAIWMARLAEELKASQ